MSSFLQTTPARVPDGVNMPYSPEVFDSINSAMVPGLWPPPGAVWDTWM